MIQQPVGFRGHGRVLQAWDGQNWVGVGTMASEKVAGSIAYWLSLLSPKRITAACETMRQLLEEKERDMVFDPEEVRRIRASEGLIPAIKYVRETTYCGLIEARDTVYRLT